MKLTAVMVVWNDADVLQTNIAYHQRIGVSEFRIVDNGSTDDTPRILQELARRDRRVRWTRDEGAFRNSEIITGLAHQATTEGADWVVPIDADEFWAPDGGRSLPEILGERAEGAVSVRVVNFVQERRCRKRRPAGLITMTYRVADPIGPPDACEDLVTSGRISYVEMQYPPKWISRGSTELVIHPGNHFVEGVDPLGECTDIVCLHAPLRARSILEKKAEHGRRVLEAGVPPGLSWHVKRWYRLSQEGALDAEWERNSQLGGRLRREGSSPLVMDQRLRLAAQPFV